MDAKLMQIIYHTVQTYNILPLTSACNVRCLFCSHHQNPAGIKAVAVPPLPMELVKDLLEFIDGNRKIVIGESASLIMEGEPFTHPQFFACLDLIRDKFPNTLIQITTNGSFLDEETVKKLVYYQPLEINLSLNIAGKAEREILMKDQRADISCRAPYILNKYGLTYHGSVVAMPHITGWEYLYNTLQILSENGAETIRVFKPGFTKYTRQDLLISQDTLKMLEEKILNWRQHLCPLTLEPVILDNLEAKIVGVIKNSPADKVGIKAGDIILSINGIKPFSRVEAFKTMNKVGNYRLLIKRKEDMLEILLDIYQEKSGLVFDYDISRQLVENIKELISNKGALNPLLLASEFGYKLLQVSFADVYNLNIIPVQNVFFGGNIKSAGLLVVEDLQKAYLEFIKTKSKPDLIIVPALAFDINERDLTGTGVWQLEEVAQCPVILA